MAVVLDEGVYHIMVDLIMSETGTIEDPFPIAGIFLFFLFYFDVLDSTSVAVVWMMFLLKGKC